MFYIHKENGVHKVMEIEKADDHNNLRKQGYDIKGQFGRIEYAQHWADYYNGKITKQEHRKFLGL